MKQRVSSGVLSAVVFVLLAASLLSCATGKRTQHFQHNQAGRDDTSSIELRPPSDAGASYSMRQSVVAVWSAGQQAFDAVVEFHPTRTVLVGLTPVGGVAFVVTHAKGEVTIDNRSGREFPFAPQRIIEDLQRVFFPWQASANPSSGATAYPFVTERTRGTGKHERVFCDPQTQSRCLPVATVVWADEFAVRANDAMVHVPKRATLTTERGYSLTITTHAISPIAPDETTSL